MRAAILVIVIILAGCALTPPPAPAAAETMRFPDDVRRDPQRLGRKTVEWAGILKSIERTSDSRSEIAVLTVEHRYLDENARPADAPERLRYFPSTRGEGLLRIPVRIRTPEDRVRIGVVQAGDLIFTYGHTASIAADGTITLSIREQFDEGVYAAIAPRWFDASTLDYGRDSNVPARWSAPPTAQYKPPYPQGVDPLTTGRGSSRDDFYFLLHEERRQMMIDELTRMPAGLHMDHVVSVLGPPDDWHMKFVKVSLDPGPFGHYLKYETIRKSKDSMPGHTNLVFGADQRLMEIQIGVQGFGHVETWPLRHNAWVMRMRSE
jgi:hypothetical protein